MQIKIINAHEGNWYKVGEVYRVNPQNPYENIGVRVFRSGFEAGAKYPDVVSRGDFEEVS